MLTLDITNQHAKKKYRRTTAAFRTQLFFITTIYPHVPRLRRDIGIAGHEFTLAEHNIWAELNSTRLNWQDIIACRKLLRKSPGHRHQLPQRESQSPPRSSTEWTAPA